MNAEELHAIARSVRDDLQQTETVRLLQQMADGLANLAENPTDTGAQQRISDGRSQFAERLATAASREFPPVWQKRLRELGIADLLAPEIDARVEEIFQRNEITPLIARDELRALLERTTALQDALNQLLNGMEWLGIPEDHLEPGEFEIGVLVPRDAVDNELAELGGEFVDLEKTLLPFVELSTGSRPPIRVDSISGSDFGISLDTLPAVAMCLAVAIERITQFYERVLNIRRLRQELQEEEVSQDIVEQVGHQATSRMEQGIETIVDELLALFPNGRGTARENELRTEIRKALRGIARRIDHGYNIAVSTGPAEPEPPEGEEESADAMLTRQARDEVAQRRDAMQFMVLEGKPILSLEEEESEGE